MVSSRRRSLQKKGKSERGSNGKGKRPVKGDRCCGEARAWRGGGLRVDASMPMPPVGRRSWRGAVGVGGKRKGPGECRGIRHADICHMVYLEEQ